VLHIDFLQINMTEKLTLKVPVGSHGLAAGVKTGGGVLEHITREIEIRCLPGDIPERVVVDVTALQINEALHVRDLKLDKVEILTDPDAVVVTVAPPTVMEEPKAAEAEAAPVEPELIGKKPAEGEGEAAEEKGGDKGGEKKK